MLALPPAQPPSCPLCFSTFGALYLQGYRLPFLQALLCTEVAPLVNISLFAFYKFLEVSLEPEGLACRLDLSPGGRRT